VLPYDHPFNIYYNAAQPNDFTQTVLFAPAQLLVNGSLTVSFFLNDFQTSYSIYAEAYNTLGQTGVATLRQSLSTVKPSGSF
jgi:hypothetical protein